jgi:hypothetical protein
VDNFWQTPFTFEAFQVLLHHIQLIRLLLCQISLDLVWHFLKLSATSSFKSPQIHLLTSSAINRMITRSSYRPICINGQPQNSHLPLPELSSYPFKTALRNPNEASKQAAIPMSAYPTIPFGNHSKSDEAFTLCSGSELTSDYLSTTSTMEPIPLQVTPHSSPRTRHVPYIRSNNRQQDRETARELASQTASK